MGSVAYEEYLRSPHWRRIRKLYRESGLPQRCRLCGDRRYQLHHRTYERFGHERLEDLEPLCETCHRTLHQVARGDLRSESLLDPVRALEARRTNPVVAQYAADRVARAEERRRSRDLAKRQKAEAAVQRQQTAAEAARAQALADQFGVVL